ncbi:hypothetical protein ACH49O_30490 [Streptomyces coeruleorubidus]|uniref:hypothetical protein n=1 Tax=Streptomyces coeruleorubidus TaxID=116188 RepID=UPI00340158F2
MQTTEAQLPPQRIFPVRTPAKAEPEITCVNRLGHEQDEAEVLLGWTEQVGPHSGLRPRPTRLPPPRTLAELNPFGGQERDGVDERGRVRAAMERILGGMPGRSNGCAGSSVD